MIIQDTESGKYFKGPTIDCWTFFKKNAMILKLSGVNRLKRYLNKEGIKCKTYIVNPHEEVLRINQCEVCDDVVDTDFVSEDLEWVFADVEDLGINNVTDAQRKVFEEKICSSDCYKKIENKL